MCFLLMSIFDSLDVLSGIQVFRGLPLITGDFCCVLYEKKAKEDVRSGGGGGGPDSM